MWLQVRGRQKGTWLKRTYSIKGTSFDEQENLKERRQVSNSLVEWVDGLLT